MKFFLRSEAGTRKVVVYALLWLMFVWCVVKF